MSDIMNLGDEFGKLSAGIRRKLATVPRHAKIAIENYSKDAFKNGKWDGQPWEKRSSKDKSDRRLKDSPRQLMTKTRRLERSIKANVFGWRIQVGTNVVYAKIHNEGGTIQHPGGTSYIVRQAGGRGRTSRLSAGTAIFVKNSKVSALAAKGRIVGKTRPHPIKMPKRQFMGYSKELITQLEKLFERLLG